MPIAFTARPRDGFRPWSRHQGILVQQNVLTTLDVGQTGALEQVLPSSFYDRVSDHLENISHCPHFFFPAAVTSPVSPQTVPWRPCCLLLEPLDGMADVA